jgi:hypothetical protein
LNLFTHAKKQGYVGTASPYSSTPFKGGVLSVCAMHELSKGQAHVVALLSPAAGIPLAATVKFSRSGNLWNRFVAIKIGQEDLTSHPVADKGA